MPEPIFEEDVFEKEPPTEETLDELINQVPEPMRALLKIQAGKYKQDGKEPESHAPNFTRFTLLRPEAMQYRLFVLREGNIQEYEAMLNDQWQSAEAFTFNDYAIVTLCKHKMEEN